MIFGTAVFARSQGRAAILLLGLLGGCEPPLENVVLREDFEQVAPPNTSQEYAHSWKQALKAGQPIEYSKLSECSWEALGRPHRLRLRLWVRLPNAQFSFARLVLEIRRPGTAPGAPPNVLHSQLQNLCEIVKRYQQWEPTTLMASLPRGLQPSDQVLVFMWVPPNQGNAVYIDDFSLEKLN